MTLIAEGTLVGTEGNDTFIGTGIAETINGKAGNDIIYGLGKGDHLSGEKGNDLLDGGAGNDTLFGGNDDDILSGGIGDDSLSGDLGNDNFIGAGGFDTINGGDGNDTVTYANSGAVTLRSQGELLKNNDTKDRLINIETIIANGAAKHNTIDTSTAGAGIIINANLQTQSLQVFNIPSLSNPLAFTVGEFDDVIGSDGNDTITGDKQANILSGGGGNDAIDGGDGNDTLSGGTGNDSLLGGAGTDLYRAGVGNDTFNGGTGTDTADYSGIAQNMTLLPTGVIKKEDGTKDQLISVENIIANTALSNNTIDASTAGASVSINVNLQSKSLKVFGIPGVPANPLKFKVQNFDNVIGTNQNDRIAGDSQSNILSGGGGNDTLIGGVGRDTLAGGDGTDTVDYSKFQQSIVLLPTGLIKKADSTTDDIDGVETIIANSTVANNTIDNSIATAPVSIEVDLFANTLKVYDIPGVPINPLSRTVKNFDNVIGTNQKDKITGDTQGNILAGGGGDDILNGGTGNDTLSGGSGADIFLFDKLASVGLDTIEDFLRSDGDIVQVSKSGFGAASTDQFSYSNVTGALSFNGQQFATLEGGVSFVPSSDLILV